MKMKIILQCGHSILEAASINLIKTSWLKKQITHFTGKDFLFVIKSTKLAVFFTSDASFKSQPLGIFSEFYYTFHYYTHYILLSLVILVLSASVDLHVLSPYGAFQGQ